MNSNTQTSDIDEVLNETEIGSFIAKNKGLVIGLVIGVMVAIIGYGIYNQNSNKTNDEYNAIIYNFKQNTFSDFMDKKVNTDVLLQELEKIGIEIGAYKGLNLLYFTVSDELVDQKDLNNALAVLQKAQNVSDPYSAYFLATRKAAILEDLGKPAEALAELEGMSEVSKKLMEDKIYLDMGRLQMKTGDMARARASFEYLQDKVVQDEFSKLAKFYLYEMNQNTQQPTEVTIENQ